jgi:hypothetical protein
MAIVGVNAAALGMAWTNHAQIPDFSYLAIPIAVVGVLMTAILGGRVVYRPDQ